MIIKQFFEAYLGLWIESNKSSDQSTNDQCVDLWRVYNRKVIKAPDIFGNPPVIWNNYQSDFYERIPNTPTFIPQLGDVPIWKKNYGGYGHIAVCTGIADIKTFISFDQNDPLGEPCHFQPHTYSNVQGFLRPKNQQPLGDEPLEEDIVLKLVKEAFKDLTDDDSLKKGNLEGYIRQIVEEHKKYKEYEEDSKQLNGFISKWAEKWDLKSTDDLVEIENEMSKLLPMEDNLNTFRKAIEKAVGKNYSDDKALLKALEAIGDDKEAVEDDLTEANLKLSNRKILYAFTLLGYLVKIYEKKKKEA